MTANAVPSPETLKRRLSWQIAGFLLVVAALTIGLFRVIRGDLIAFRLGADALARADFATAATALETAWNQGYRTPQARLSLAQALTATKRYREALPLYQEALAAEPRNESLIEALAGLHEANGEPEKALALYTALGPPTALSLRALSRLGELQQQAGHFEAALATYRLGLQRAPNQPNLLLRAGIMLAWTGHLKESAALLQKAAALDPNSTLAQRYLARVLMWDGQFADAVTAYRRTLPQ